MESTITLDFDRNLIKYINFFNFIINWLFYDKSLNVTNVGTKKKCVPYPKTYILPL